MNCVTPRVTCSVQLPRRKRVPYNSPRYDIGDSIATTLDEPDRGNAHPFPRVLATVLCVCVPEKRFHRRNAKQYRPTHLSFTVFSGWPRAQTGSVEIDNAKDLLRAIMPTTAAAVQLEHPKNVQTLQPECSFCVCATVAFFVC